MAIEIQNISKQFGQTVALSGVSAVIEEGKIYGLLGNNGAGKTTLLNILTNRIYADAGRVLLDGEDVRDNDGALSKLFMIGEQNLYPDDMRVKRAFQTTKLFYPGFDETRASELCRRFGLDARKKITALSTGYTSIFRLITALCTDAPYLILDEPVLGLDAQHRDMFYKTLIELYSERPRTILLSTHLIGEVAGIVEHVLIIRDGKLVRDQAADELLADGYTVSGPAGLMDNYLAGKQVLSMSALGGLKTACVRGRPGEDRPEGLEFGRIGLQDYFISLMNEEEQR